ncbi:MAG: hypothetical protein WCY25_05300, partial [Moheibacter sp.]
MFLPEEKIMKGKNASFDPPPADKQPFDKLRVTGKSSERCGQHSAFSSFKGKAPSWFDIPL